MVSKFKPQYMLDEQMYFSDAKTTLAFQIREELRETNRLLKQLVESKENTQPIVEIKKAKIKKEN